MIEVRNALLAGNIDEATVLHTHVPTVLHAEESTTRTVAVSGTVDVPRTSVEPSHLNLNLRIQAFIESCRTMPLVYPPPNNGAETLTHSSKALGPKTLDQQTALLKSAQKLHALAGILPLPERDMYAKELSSVLSILAYKIPETQTNGPISRYLSQERRAAVAEQIDSAILCETG